MRLMWLSGNVDLGKVCCLRNPFLKFIQLQTFWKMKCMSMSMWPSTDTGMRPWSVTVGISEVLLPGRITGFIPLESEAMH